MDDVSVNASPAGDSIAIRQLQRSDWPALEEFIARAYGEDGPYKTWERHAWQHLENPHLDSTDGADPPLTVWAAFDGEKLIGSMGIQTGTLRIGGSDVRAGWIIDLVVDTAYRGRGLARRLHDALLESDRVLVAVTMADATRRIVERAGCVTLTECRQYGLPVAPAASDVGRYLALRTRNRPPLARAARILGRVGGNHGIALALRVRRRKKPAPGIAIEEVSPSHADFDLLWRSVADGHAAVFTRDTQHVAWRFGAAPQLRYRCFMARRDGRPVGYVITRVGLPQELRTGIIADVLAAEDDREVLDALVRHAVRTFGRSVAAVEAGASSPNLQAALRSGGFVVTKRHFPTVVSTDPVVRAEIERTRAGWWLTKGDHDWDQVRPV